MSASPCLSSVQRLLVEATLILSVGVAGCAEPLVQPKVRVATPATAPPRAECNDVASCERSCQSGSVEGCHRAIRLMREKPLETDAARFADVLSRSCDLKDSGSCNRLAELVIGSPALPRDEDRSKKLYERSCAMENGIACLTMLGPSAVERPAGADRAAFDRAAALLQTSCDAHQGASCAVLGALYLGTSPPDPEKSQELARKAGVELEASCLGGKADDCVVGAMQVAGPRGTDDSARVKRLLEAGCSNRAFEACTFLANGPAIGEAINSAFLGKACDGGREDACLALGLAIESSAASRGASSLAHAKDLLSRGVKLAKAHCDLAEASSCETLAKSLMLDIVPAEEAQKTSDYLEIACERHSMITCNDLSVALATGPKALRDEARAARLKARSCELGYPFACPDPMAKMGIDRQVFAVILDRRTGLEWAPVPSGTSRLEVATRRCRDLRFDGHADWRLPTKKELESLLGESSGLRPFARATMPHDGLLHSNETSGDAETVLDLAGGRLSTSKDANAFTRCVRKGNATSATRPLLTLRMSEPNLDVVVHDARGKVLVATTVVQPRAASALGEDWEERKVAGPVDVEVEPTVDWVLAARFLEGAKNHGLALGRIAVDGKEKGPKP